MLPYTSVVLSASSANAVFEKPAENTNAAAINAAQPAVKFLTCFFLISFSLFVNKNSNQLFYLSKSLAVCLASRMDIPCFLAIDAKSSYSYFSREVP